MTGIPRLIGRLPLQRKTEPGIRHLVFAPQKERQSHAPLPLRTAHHSRFAAEGSCGFARI